MEIQSLSFLPVSGNQNYVYNYADVNVVVKTDHRVSVSDSYWMLLYSDKLQLMAKTRTKDHDHTKTSTTSSTNFIKRSGSQLVATLHSDLVWCPGNYFLIVRSSTGEKRRFDIELDEQCNMTVTGANGIATCGMEDVLSETEILNLTLSNKCLASLPGLVPLRQWLVKRRQESRLNVMRDKECKEKPLKFNDNLLLETHCGSSSIPLIGTMITTFAGLNVRLIKADCSTFCDRTASNPFENLSDLLEGRNMDAYETWPEGSNDTIYLFYNLWALNNSDGKLVLAKIRQYWPREKTAAIFCGTPQEIDTLLNDNPSLKAFFPEQNRIATEVATAAELIQLFFYRACYFGYLKFTPETVDMLCRSIARAHRDGLLDHWGDKEIRQFVNDNLLEKYRTHAVRAVQEGYSVTHTLEVKPEDLDVQALLPTTTSTSALFDELNGLIGLDEVKQHVITMANSVRFNNQRRCLGLPVEDGVVYHSVFTGNPGTGKTTVAKLMGRLFHSMGLLSKGDVIAVERSKMVGEYIGQTEQIMKQILNEARGNVLFVDEAYTLYKADSEKDVGRIAIECLLTVLSSEHPDMVVIFAGYEQKMDALFTMNDGLRGRFPYHLHFADYNADQLMQIALRLLNEGQYILTPDAEALLRQTIGGIVANNRMGTQFSNARWINQLVSNGILPAMADRLMTAVHVLDKSSYQTIQAIDVMRGCAKFCTGTVLPSRNVIGFRA